MTARIARALLIAFALMLLAGCGGNDNCFGQSCLPVPTPRPTPTITPTA